jgi:O-acetyl-ADP-ribose deacetylase
MITETSGRIWERHRIGHWSTYLAVNNGDRLHWPRRSGADIAALVQPAVTSLGMTKIEVVLGDITTQDVDAIVNAANETMLGGGGVDGAIHRAAGPRLAAAGAAIGPCKPGDAKATPAFDLDPPVHHIIHTVGPVWRGGYGEAGILASCYRRSLEVADGLRARSVAFPAIATGAYGFPPGPAAKIAVETIRSVATAVQEVRLIAFDEPTRDLLAEALRT